MPPIAHPGRLLKRELGAPCFSANRPTLDLGVPSGQITDIKSFQCQSGSLGLANGRLARGVGYGTILTMQHEEIVTTAEYGYTVLFQLEPEGGYTVTCPALPGLVTYGETLEDARAMAEDAVRGYIECLREDGEPIPESDPAPAPLVDRVSVKGAG